MLLELLSEEIPARMQAKASADLVRLFEGELAKAGLKAAAVEAFVTPRRLALVARGLPLATAPVATETKGPRADAPSQAIAGFLGKTGLTREQLVERTDAKGNAVLFAVIETPGRATADVLADAVPAIVRGFPWPKAMRWGAASHSTESPRWVRPLQGLVLLLDGDVVPCAVAGVTSGRTTAGHRFLHAGPVTIATPGDYVAALRAAHVVADADERRALIRDGAHAAADAAGLTLVEDEGLVAENAGLTEWPVPLLGRFDPAFLDVPPEVIQLTARVNQKYFVCRDAGGSLANAFVCTANIAAPDGGAAIVEGNRKVLAARLADARFFYETDLKVPLADRAAKLDRIVFHEKLGTVADKVQRVAKLARWLVEEGIVSGTLSPAGRGQGEGQRGAAERPASPSATLTQPSPSRERAFLADLAEQAALLCKADLVTGMVGEFPELQGVMGGYYAAAQGLDPQIAAAIRDHYKPVGQGDEVPTAPVTVAVALGDKLDTLVGFFLIDQRPTGSRDPFALRRACIGIIELLTKNQLRVCLIFAIGRSVSAFTRQICNPGFPEDRLDEHKAGVGLAHLQLPEFFIDRLKVQQRQLGVRHDLIDAVVGDEDDLVRLLARVKALQAFVATDDGANLLAGYRRAANILRAETKKDGAATTTRHPGEGRGPEPQATPPVALDAGLRRHDEEATGSAFAFPYAPEPAEQALADALAVQLPIAEAAIGQEDFATAMTALSVIRPAIDRFFDDVTVVSPDETVRATRLALLATLIAAMHKIADFSKIEG